MDYCRRELADRLAAEYVLGTMASPARRRFEALLPAHPALRDAVAAWQKRLLPMAAAVPPVTPAASVWQRVQGELFPGPVTGRPPSWQRRSFWQGLTGFALVGLVGMALLLGNPPPASPPVVVLLTANEASGAMPASFVASLNADGRALVLKPVNAPVLSARQALELWAVPAQGAPRSLGLLSAGAGATVQRPGLLAGVAAYAVSLEPAGGSPTGAPTGPILSVGKLPS